MENMLAFWQFGRLWWCLEIVWHQPPLQERRPQCQRQKLVEPNHSSLRDLSDSKQLEWPKSLAFVTPVTPMVFGAKFIIRRREKGPSVKGRQRRQTIFFFKSRHFSIRMPGWSTWWQYSFWTSTTTKNRRHLLCHLLFCILVSNTDSCHTEMCTCWRKTLYYFTSNEVSLPCAFLRSSPGEF